HSNLACFLGGAETDEKPLSNVTLLRRDHHSKTQEDDEPSAIELPKEVAATSVIAGVKPNGSEWKWENDLIDAASAILFNDPRRRFLFGFTIDDADVRLWYFGRGHISCSEPFNLRKNDFFLRFILFILFATPAELGFDPTVKRRRLPALLSSSFAVFIRTSSRATRVWIVRKVTSPSDAVDTLSEACYVLKDAWIDDDAPLQKTIQQDIFANLVQAKENGDKDLQDVSEDDYRQHFMNIVSDWVVTFGDGTRDLRFKLPNTDDDSDNSDNASISSSTENDYSPRRKHVRTIFAEVCQTIFEVRDVRSMILTLQGVTK
ncbi:hypothetical protein H0H92_012344, partial [Tricholoma furcatifolium]